MEVGRPVRGEVARRTDWLAKGQGASEWFEAASLSVRAVAVV